MIPTQREKEILRKLCEGYSSKEIGAALFISPFTVESHKRNLMSKLRARNTVHLAVIAERQGWTKIKDRKRTRAATVRSNK